MRLKHNKICLMLLFCFALTSGCMRYLTPTVFPISAEVSIDLSQMGAAAETEFHVWHDDTYSVKISYDTFGASFDDNAIIQYLGGWQTARGTGASIPLRVLITRLTRQGEDILVDEIKYGGGITSLGITNTIGVYPLKSGKYRLQITNMESHRQLKYVPVKIWIWYSRNK